MPEGTDDPRLSAEGEVALARLAIDENDFTHAASHIAGALAHDPTLPEAHEALAVLASRHGPEAADRFYPMEANVFIGAVVARAHLCAGSGQLDEALQLLAQATAHTPDQPWADVGWVEDPELPGRISPDTLMRTFMITAGGLADPVPEPARPALLPYLRLAERSVKAYPTAGLLLGAASALARRMDETATAVAWASEGVRQAPSMMTEMWLGYAQRRAGHLTEGVAALRRAIRHDQDNFALYADAASWLAEAGRIDEGIAVAEEALNRDPTYDCAYEVACRLRFERDGDVRHLVDLADFRREHRDRSHEHSDLESACSGQNWLGDIPTASEACINVLRQILDQGADLSTGGSLSLSDLEVPSALAVLARTLPGLSVNIQEVKPPDIRSPRRQVRPLWRYDGRDAAPAVPPPGPAAVEAIMRVAHPRFGHPPEAYDEAVALAGLDPEELVGLLVHPPQPPDTELGRALAEHDPALWVRTVQVWACLGLLHHRADEPWKESRRRQLLVDIAYGQEDWTMEAALFALITAGWVDPSARPDVAELVGWHLLDTAKAAGQRAVTIDWSIATLALRTPGIDREVLLLARQMLGQDTEKPPPDENVSPAKRGLRRWFGKR